MFKLKLYIFFLSLWLTLLLFCIKKIFKSQPFSSTAQYTVFPTHFIVPSPPTLKLNYCLWRELANSHFWRVTHKPQSIHTPKKVVSPPKKSLIKGTEEERKARKNRGVFHLFTKRAPYGVSISEASWNQLGQVQSGHIVPEDKLIPQSHAPRNSENKSTALMLQWNCSRLQSP